MKLFTHLVLGLFGFASLTFAAQSNAVLSSTMKAIAKDVGAVADPTKKENPADVTDATILTGIVRARTASYSLQLVIDRREGEMFPTVLATLPPEQKNEKLTLYASLLKKAQGKLATAETLLQTELAKANPGARDFVPLKNLIGELGAVIQEAHTAFQPE